MPHNPLQSPKPAVTEADVQTDPLPEPAPGMVHAPVPKTSEPVDFSRLPTPDDPGGEDLRIKLRQNLQRLQEIVSQLEESYRSSPEEGILSQMVEVKQKIATTTHQLATREPDANLRLRLQLDELEATFSRLELSHHLVHGRDMRNQTESPEKQGMQDEMKHVEQQIASVKQQLVVMGISVCRALRCARRNPRVRNLFGAVPWLRHKQAPTQASAY